MRYDSPYERMMGLHLYQANTDLGNKATAAPKAESTPLPDLEGSMVSTPDDSMAVATAEPPQTFGSFVQENWLPLAGALVGLALIATVLAVLLRRRKKPGAEPVGAAAHGVAQNVGRRAFLELFHVVAALHAEVREEGIGCAFGQY